jgi:hypothetical protein
MGMRLRYGHKVTEKKKKEKKKTLVLLKDQTLRTRSKRVIPIEASVRSSQTEPQQEEVYTAE